MKVGPAASASTCSDPLASPIEKCAGQRSQLDVRPRHWVLWGVGHAHVHVLRALQAHPLEGVEITVITPNNRLLYSGMVPGWIAGHYQLDECAIPLGPLLEHKQLHVVQGSGVALNAAARTITLASGGQVQYDWLSLNTGPVMRRDLIEATIPGASAHAAWVRPMDELTQWWPRVQELASRGRVQLAVIGAGAAGLELAMGAAHALAALPGGRGHDVTLVTGGPSPGHIYPQAVQRRLLNALSLLHIAVVRDRCVGIGADHLRLGDGSQWPCNAPLLAVGAQAPEWLANSGLALDGNGFVAVNAYQQSVSHANVFAVGDVASRVDAPHPKSGVYAVRAGPPLMRNLLATVQGSALQAYRPRKRALNLIACGGQSAIGIWGPLHAEGRWVWRLKDRIDRAFVGLCR